jgi:hypothetical protein
MSALIVFSVVVLLIVIGVVLMSISGSKLSKNGTFSCEGGQCVRKQGLTGQFFTQKDCQDRCNDIANNTWQCNASGCAPASGGIQGPFTSKNSCIANCPATPTPLSMYSCVGGKCVPDSKGTMSKDKCAETCKPTLEAAF